MGCVVARVVLVSGLAVLLGSVLEWAVLLGEQCC